MRLTCPSCDAQYEVDEAVIPEDGRDVQCSSCGHTWFQASAASLAEHAQSAASQDLEEAVDSDFDDSFFASADASPPPFAQVPPVPEATEPESTTDQPMAATATEPRRRTLDDAVRNVLREEAEREVKARQAEGSALETQGDLGLSAPVAAVSATAAEVGEDRQAAEHAEDTVEALVSRTARRELLPDIEEINSTLRATSERGNEAAAKDAPQTLRQKRNGFRRGFITSLVAMALLLLPYLFADGLSARFPSAASALTRYVGGIDGIRLWMDERMRSTTELMRDTSQP